MSTSTTAQAAVAKSLAEGKRLAATGERIVGIIGWRVPVEPVFAAGYFPVTISPDLSLPTPDADELLSADARPPVRALLQMVLSGELDFCDLLVFAPPYAPIAAQTEELRRMALVAESLPPIHYFETPMLRGEVQCDFAIERTRDLVRRLSAASGTPVTSGALEQQIVAANAVRRQVKQLLAERAGDSIPAGSELLNVIGAGNWLSFSEHAELAEKAMASVTRLSGLPRLLLVSSSVLGDDRIHALVEAAGANIVAEDDIYGSCYAAGEIAENSADPIAAIGRFYHDNQPLQRTSPLELRRRWYFEQVTRADIDGVIFYAEDPIWGWDVPAMREAAKAAGKPSLTVLKDVRIPAEQQAVSQQLNEFIQTLTARVSA
ncbi:2-hydroxyacyl-CoA dehydratase family protein [Alteromonas lipolytica]|uniref:2-hydroxyacyl-CoA dehydratase n=1 Tax=Alteromonas lipolytica TaxID=1856405 RepID=A0A1E8FC52_9ALTE|nr:2-hydroxyacyl-CoA dehydratase family protein [Alteromonas lipolytica]OFI33502.1 hypothetical protein BFC17_04385 [Alteromonas lipolytica]GGF59101.1 hypothetical protein GCM10011338_09230 [Alteromonas lipolytica]